MKKNKIIKKSSLVLAFILFGVILAFNVNAYAVSSPYWDEKPMYVQPGEVKEFNYLLQNMVGDKDVKVQAQLEPGTTIMEFVDKNTIYNVPFGTRDIPVNMRIKVPNDAKEGTWWDVGVRFKTVEETRDGPLTIGIEYSKGFKVVVGELGTATENVSGTVTKPILSTQTLGFLVLVVALVILVLIIKYFHKKKENKNA